MEYDTTDASDGSVQEIAVNDRNPITTAQNAATATRAHGAPDGATKPKSSEAATELGNMPVVDHGNDWEIVDEGDNPFAKKGFGQQPMVGGAKTTVGLIVKLPLDRLLPHPQNKTLFGASSPNEIKELAESIAETGQQSPIIVTADLEKIGYYTIISGHKRAEALRSMGRNEANCQVEDVKDADERLLRLLEAKLREFLDLPALVA